MSGNKFCFVAPAFNAAKTLPRMLHSLYGQSYDDWRLILIDDVSDKENVLSCKDTLDRFNDILPDKVTTIWNTSKKWEVANVLKGISLCADDEIVCRIDADDALSDLDALAILNSAYAKTNCDVLWSMHRWGLSDRNISGPMHDQADPYVVPWTTSHLKTFRKNLLNDVPLENFINMDGDLVKRCGDQALYLPVLRNAKKRVFLPRVLYHYSIDEMNGAVYQTDDAKFQKREADFIRSRGYISTGISWESIL